MAFESGLTAIKIPCCLCATLIYPNEANQCGTCLAQDYDLKAELERGDPTVYQCRKCRRYERTSTVFEDCGPESPQLLSICLKNLPALQNNKGLYKVKEASWVWTEPHSMRFKVKLLIQSEIQNVVVQQRVMVELYCRWKQCPDCNKEYTNRTWTAKLQLRQRRKDHSHKGLFSLEQAIKSNANIRRHVLSVDATSEGLDFYFTTLAEAQMFSNYLRRVVPMKVSTSVKLVSTDNHSNTAHQQHTISCNLVPLCVHDLVVVEKVCRGNKLAGQLMLVLKVKSALHCISASPVRNNLAESMVELSPDSYYRNEKFYRVLQASNRLIRFVVIDVEPCDQASHTETELYRGPQSGIEKYALADVMLSRESDFGDEHSVFCCVTHLGNLIQPGDIVLGYDLTTFVGDVEGLNKQFVWPDIVLVKKVTEGKKKQQEADPDMIEKQPKLSKKKQRRRRRKENRKMKDLEEHVSRMGFYDDEEEDGDDNAFTDALEQDSEMAQELEALEKDFAELESKHE